MAIVAETEVGALIDGPEVEMVIKNDKDPGAETRTETAMTYANKDPNLQSSE